ncbi:MAG: dihydroorotase [Spirochaetes bacterium]|uniref:Dihydroorotase n=1 Tax=Candidatus Avitreponema avistercoris TaxID=2840705 RepID=A0A9D9ENK2_9SPIR|nr:dihydroorotase [Candidatus Avitreponema avistercoris]
MTDKNSGLLQKALRLSETGSPQPAEKRRGSVFVQHARLVDRDTDTPGAVLICGGKIAEVYTGDNLAAAEKAAQAARAAGIPVVDAQGKILTPAFTDLHAHFRDPGFPEKETLESGSRAAVAGGYTAAVLMANTDPVISSAGAAADVVRRAAQYGRLRVFQAVSLTAGFNGTDVSPLSVLQPQDVPLASEDGRDVEQAAVMLDAMQACAAAGLMVSCHSEEASLGVRANRMRQAGDFRAAERLFRLAEEINTERNLLLAEEAGCRVHIAHVSTKDALEAVRRAKERRRGFVSCEATPHHLCLHDGSLNGGTGDTVNPPLRPESDRQALVEGLCSGVIDVIATDHAPHTAADKRAGAPGFSGIQTAFSLCYTELVQTGVLSFSGLSARMAAAPAALLSLPRGLLKTGYDGDVALIDPAASFTVDPDSPFWFSRGKNTPLRGRVLSGAVLRVWKAGEQVFRLAENAEACFPG